MCAIFARQRYPPCGMPVVCTWPVDGTTRSLKWSTLHQSGRPYALPLPNDQRTACKVLKISPGKWLKPRLESGRDCLMSAEFARRRIPASVEVRHPSVVMEAVAPILATFDLDNFRFWLLSILVTFAQQSLGFLSLSLSQSLSISEPLTPK